MEEVRFNKYVCESICFLHLNITWKPFSMEIYHLQVFSININGKPHLFVCIQPLWEVLCTMCLRIVSRRREKCNFISTPFQWLGKWRMKCSCSAHYYFSVHSEMSQKIITRLLCMIRVSKSLFRSFWLNPHMIHPCLCLPARKLHAELNQLDTGRS